MLVFVAVLGCFLGRVLGPRLKTCPYLLSAQMAAALPIVVGLARSSALGLCGILVGIGALLGVYLSGHNSRLRALTFCALGAGLGALLGQPLLT